MSLAILIHIFRQQFTLFRNQPWLRDEFSNVLEATSKFDVQDTTLELQHVLCTLESNRSQGAERRRPIAWYILKPIRHIYTTLHGDADSAPTRFSTFIRDHDQILWRPSSYPLCNVPSHHPDSTPHTHDASEASKTSAHSVLHGDDALVPVYLDNTFDAPSIHDKVVVPISFHPAHQTTTKSQHVSTTSPDPAPARRGVGLSARSVPPPVPERPETSASLPPLPPTSPPSAVALEYSAYPQTYSDSPDFVSSPSPNPVLENILPTALSW